jgi:hypothetical protein
LRAPPQFAQVSLLSASFSSATVFPSVSLQKDEIVVRLVEGLDPTRMLGKHKYKNILNAGWPYDPRHASCAFIYDYQSNGDPSDRAYTAIYFYRSNTKNSGVYRITTCLQIAGGSTYRPK